MSDEVDHEGPSEAERWLRFAARDLDAAVLLANDPAIRCFHAQQAAEKAIKGVLVAHEIQFPFTHDLDLLRDMAPAECAFVKAFPKLRELTDWSVASRYPGDYEEPTEADAVIAASIALSLVAAIERDLAALWGVA